jgi:hypothetical protein
VGTSTASNGPGANVSMDPPWLDLIDFSADPDVGDGSDVELEEETGKISDLVAPARRYFAARRNMRSFVETGSTESLARAVGHFSRGGSGGASRLANRMRLSTATAGRLIQTLRDARDLPVSEKPSWMQDLLSARATADEVLHAIVAHASPPGGSLDEESARLSQGMALSELLRIKPDVDLLSLSDEDIWTLTENFLGNEACARIQIDLGPVFENSRIDPVVLVQRSQEMNRFVRAEIAQQIQRVAGDLAKATYQRLTAMIQSAIRLTFEVFEQGL